nr:protocadherin-16-like [Cavia porcellus]
MGARRPRLGVRVPERLLFPGRTGSPRGWRGCGARARRCMLGLLVHAWLWAVSGSSAQVLNLSLSVDEGLPPDTLVGDLRAGLPAQQQQEAGGFFLSEDSDDSPLLDDFHVHPDTGVIRTARRLDRERRDRYSFVAATLRGAVVQVEIRVNDVNDHAPRFPRDTLQLDVSELSPPGTAFRLPGAQDLDAGRFSTQGYTLLPPPEPPEDPAGPLFRLRYGTPGPPPSPLEPLDLVLLRRLDREAAATHELQIEAWDGGSPRRTGHLRVQLRVLDENDNPPVFEQAEYRASVREDAPPGAEVCRVRATDRDLGPNGRVRYGLRVRPGTGVGGEAAGSEAYFEVEELSGLVRVRRSLDREAQAWHQLVVEARDGGAEPEVATVRVSVAVLDVNDNRPNIHLLFLTEGGAARVSEGARPGDYVARVSVSDADGDSGEEEVEAAGTLGVGLGGGSSVSLALEGGAGAFALRPGGAPGVFFLCVEGPLDRESCDLYELRLVAVDAGFPPLSTQETLLLQISDLNDQPPVFSQEHYRASVSEAVAPGTTVVWVSASDADEAGTNHARLRYTLVQLSALCNPGALQSGTECGPSFAIHPNSGVISTVRTLDREIQKAVELKVVAQDFGEPPLSATCLVSITVDDVNDNEPIFQRQVYNVTLAEHTPVGHCFLQVSASRPGLEGVERVRGWLGNLLWVLAEKTEQWAVSHAQRWGNVDRVQIQADESQQAPWLHTQVAGNPSKPAPVVPQFRLAAACEAGTRFVQPALPPVPSPGLNWAPCRFELHSLAACWQPDPATRAMSHSHSELIRSLSNVMTGQLPTPGGHLNPNNALATVVCCVYCSVPLVHSPWKTLGPPGITMHLKKSCGLGFVAGIRQGFAVMLGVIPEALVQHT